MVYIYGSGLPYVHTVILAGKSPMIRCIHTVLANPRHLKPSSCVQQGATSTGIYTECIPGHNTSIHTECITRHNTSIHTECITRHTTSIHTKCITGHTTSIHTECITRHNTGIHTERITRHNTSIHTERITSHNTSIQTSCRSCAAISLANKTNRTSYQFTMQTKQIEQVINSQCKQNK
jgi:hypothetical protein